jgi:hypothetical protein
MSLVALGYSFGAIPCQIGKSKKNVAHCVGGFDTRQSDPLLKCRLINANHTPFVVLGPILMPWQRAVESGALEDRHASQ